ncbi:MAG: glycoside hydrolase family 88 protein [Prolixibacteraceae bacterium]
MNNKSRTLLFATMLSLVLWACSMSKKPQRYIEENLDYASRQIGLQLDAIEKTGKILNPRTIDKQGAIHYVGFSDWTSGFFPGTMWYLYEMTGTERWKEYGTKITESLDSAKYLTWHHDVGFIINCSFGNAFRLTGKKEYKQVMIKAAESLSTRFRPAAGVIQSWDADRGWQATRGWKCPVIIDNMMNLELLFRATELSGDSSFYKIAVSHANQTMRNHFRDDYSSWHVVDYDPVTGEVRQKNRAQGYADESAWARGQAWALYGYTVCYRETKDPAYLQQAENIAVFILNHPRLPGDLIPYWDFDAPGIPNEPRDVSAAAIIASALYELGSYSNHGDIYLKKADQIMNSLASPAYRATPGTNNYFLLMHSVGSIPHNTEIDVPLNYADYYFLEALRRKMNLKK